VVSSLRSIQPLPHSAMAGPMQGPGWCGAGCGPRMPAEQYRFGVQKGETLAVSLMQATARRVAAKAASAHLSCRLLRATESVRPCSTTLGPCLPAAPVHGAGASPHPAGVPGTR
jgi:hypothetical protein